MSTSALMQSASAESCRIFMSRVEESCPTIYVTHTHVIIYSMSDNIYNRCIRNIYNRAIHLLYIMYIECIYNRVIHLLHIMYIECIYIMHLLYTSISRLLKIIGLFCKRALKKRRYSAKETYNFVDPIDRSHPISHLQESTTWFLLWGGYD